MLLKTINICCDPTSRLRNELHILCRYKFAFFKKNPSGCFVLIYSSSDLLEPPEENFKQSVIYLITFFSFSMYLHSSENICG